MEKYASYTMEEFAADVRFKQWVLKTDPKQDLFWQKFLFQYPEKVEDIKEAKAFILALEQSFPQKKTSSDQLKQFFKELENKTLEPKIQPLKPPRSKRSYTQWAMAATILFLFGGVALWWLFNPALQKNNIRTAYGEWKKLTLPDSSIVQLNANSEIHVPEEWEKGADRKVWLETGEAFFEVTKQPATKAKFLVITDDVTIEVLGTAFNVNAQEDQTEVYLEEGKIRLIINGEERLMKPGDFLIYSKSSQKVTVSHQSEVGEELGSWKNGTLNLSNSTGEEIFQRVEEIYGISFKVEDEALLKTHTRVGVPMDELETALLILEATFEIKITKGADNQWIVK